MSDRLQSLWILAAALGSRLIAGVFLAFSSFVMAALGRLPPPQAIAAMQSINITVINPLFMSVLFGTAALSLFLGYWGVHHGQDPRAVMLIAGAACYALGSIAVTVIFNVPLNNGLAGADPQSAAAAALWAQYLSSWTWWNHVRGVAALAASAAFIRALCLNGNP
jgi:uncharacterized membrane protein